MCAALAGIYGVQGRKGRVNRVLLILVSGLVFFRALYFEDPGNIPERKNSFRYILQNRPRILKETGITIIQILFALQPLLRVPYFELTGINR